MVAAAGTLTLAAAISAAAVTIPSPSPVPPTADAAFLTGGNQAAARIAAVTADNASQQAGCT